jgi:hypothetical protein
VSARLSADEVLTPADLARRLRVHPQTVYNWRFTGKGPDSFKLGQSVFYRLEDVEAWERETGRAS